ncbi:nicotinate-nucleotide diphosphorylase (carboxylating) [Candidatus Woesearchaeota archaeon]|nr:nicotinate-nucleotide diphosphorylase (carboxylating) [Candidatus Woesearchaeota archaeon]
MDFVKKFLTFLLKEDIKNGDLTTSSIINRQKDISATIIAKENGILAGTEEFSLLNKDLRIKRLKKDGDKIKNNDVLIEIKGNAKKILERERTSLNLLQRMSGIATLTHDLVKKLNNKAKLAATRKNLWGLLDKKAVSIGNGLTHRLNLSDGIIIKDNHLKIFNHNIENVMDSVKNKSKYIEIEVENKKQAICAARIIKKLSNNENLFALMLDNIRPEEIKSIVDELKNQNLYNNLLLEASGGINPNDLKRYSDCGVDAISMGFLTNSAKALNISQEIK